MTRILLISDVHANLPALEAVLRHVEKDGGFDQVWSLGDAIGYGPQPNECLKRIRDLGALAVTGNHEQAALGKISLDDFNPHARSAVQWTTNALDPELAAYIESLPRKIHAHDFTLVHGSPRDPVWEYLADSSSVSDNLPHLETPNCANGHTHVPAVFIAGTGEPILVRPLDGEHVELGGARYFLNPGSVGQPRDGNPQACCAVFDVEARTVKFHRVSYPVDETQSLMEEAGLPAPLINRLSLGF